MVINPIPVPPSSLCVVAGSSPNLTRVSIVPKDKLMRTSPLSYSRFILETSGAVGVYFAAMLEIILFISGWVKLGTTLVLFIVLYFSIFINKQEFFTAPSGSF